jgi:hypothetical protein
MAKAQLTKSGLKRQKDDLKRYLSSRSSSF